MNSQAPLHRETEPLGSGAGRNRVGVIEKEVVGIRASSSGRTRPIVANETHMPQRSGININASTAGKIEHKCVLINSCR